MFEKNIKQKPFAGFGGFGGGGLGLGGGGSTPIEATGGTESTPGDGYKYHVYEYNSPGPFNITKGKGQVEIMLQGGGGGGIPGSPPPAGGVGGGGGATGVWTISNLGSGNHTFVAGGGGPGGSGTGGDTTFTLSDSSGTVTSTGGGAGGGDNNTSGFAGSITAERTFNGGTGGRSGTAPQLPYSPGTDGAPAGGVPQPAGNWWRPYISPGLGGIKSMNTPGTPNQSAGVGGNYGGGGGGGKGGWPMPDSYSGATGGAAGGIGRAVVRYLVP